MKYFSMFSGIGGFELGIERAFNNRQTANHTGGDSEVLLERSANTERKYVERPLSCVGYSEIDKYAIKVYERNFNGHKNYGDATTINPDTLPDFELLVGGFPCQAFSVAGKRAGFNDTRGTLFFDIARILKVKRPRHLVLENVKGLLSHDSGKTFQTILKVLSDLGYRVEWQILNSKDFGVPQNRERIYIVGHLGGECRGQVFPISGNYTETTIEGLSTISAVTGVKGVKLSPTLDTMYSKGLGSKQARPAVLKQIIGGSQGNRVYDPSGVSSTIASQAGGLGAKTGLYEVGTRIRRLTPRECERLQGFPDDWTKYNINDELISDTQRYKMCGNAVTTNVVQAVMEGLFAHV